MAVSFETSTEGGPSRQTLSAWSSTWFSSTITGGYLEVVDGDLNIHTHMIRETLKKNKNILMDSVNLSPNPSPSSDGHRFFSYVFLCEIHETSGISNVLLIG